MRWATAQALRMRDSRVVLATRGVFAVQGPPGTGKTHLATEVVRRFLARKPAGRVLVCAKEREAFEPCGFGLLRTTGSRT